MAIYHFQDTEGLFFSPDELWIEPEAIQSMPHVYIGIGTYGSDEPLKTWGEFQDVYRINQRELNNSKFDFEYDRYFIAAYPSKDGESLIPIILIGAQEGTRVLILDEDNLFEIALTYIATPDIKRQKNSKLPTILQHLLKIITNGSFEKSITQTVGKLDQNPLLVNKREMDIDYQEFKKYKKQKYKI